MYTTEKKTGTKKPVAPLPDQVREKLLPEGSDAPVILKMPATEYDPAFIKQCMDQFDNIDIGIRMNFRTTSALEQLGIQVLLASAGVGETKSRKKKA